MIKFQFGKITMRSLFLLVVCAFMLSNCAQPVKPEAEGDKEKRHEYIESEPEVHKIPKALADALPGLQNDNIYLYKEYAPTLNLVVYSPDYSLDGSMKMMAKAFLELAKDENFRKDISFWIIQVQPRPVNVGKDEIVHKTPAKKPDPRVVVWGVKPEEVDAYKKENDLASFITNSEYLLVDDKIISCADKKCESRLKLFNTIKPVPTEPEPTTPETP
jgi:hypothetical protein